ncbi:MAG: WD40 repeat domain-containing protein [Pseudomonadota bacterium]
MQSDSLSVTTRALDAPATGCGFAGSAFAVADGDGAVHLIGFDENVVKLPAHDGAVLAFATDEKSGGMFTASDDGSAKRIRANGELETLHEGRKWVDTICASDRGHVAWTVGKTVFFLKKGADSAVEIETPSTASDVAFSPDGKWLGAAVYGGALLISVANPDQTKLLPWQGMHSAIGFSPDGRFCVTAMLENALHVWRIDQPDDKHGRMGGYPAKPLSFAWTADGRYLASGGADVLVIWPFIKADGPIGQNAGVAPADEQKMVRSVGTRGWSQHIGVGYLDGSVALYDGKTQTYQPIAGPSDKGPVIDVRFSADARWLGFIREGGEAGLVKLGKP